MVDLSSFFLVVFIVSLGLTLITFALGVGGLNLPGLHHGAGHVDVHLDHGGGGHFPPDVHLPHGAHIGHDIHVAHSDAGHPAGQSHDGGAGESISPLNMATILAFLTWFGGAGYVLTEYSSLFAVLTVVLAGAVGLAGGGIVFLFLTRVLLPGQTPYLVSEDFELGGTIGTLSVGIRATGTGEMVYSKAGTRRVASARSEDGRPIERGSEVVVVRAERGVAYVQKFDEFVQGEARISSEAP